MPDAAHNMLEEIADDQHSSAVIPSALRPADDGVWLESQPVRSFDPASAQGIAVLARARALLPERRRMGHQDVLIDLRRLGAASLFGAWRLSGGAYLVLIGTSAALMTTGAYISLAALRPGLLSLFAAFGFAFNVAGIAHLAGGWGRRVQGLGSWLRQGATALLAGGACAEIAALVYVFGLGWTDATALRLAAIVTGAVLAVVASALRTHPNPDAVRLLRRCTEAQRDYERVRQQIDSEIRAARQAFENEVAVLQEAARSLPCVTGAGNALA